MASRSVAAFRFAKVRDSYAAQRGEARNVGVIGIGGLGHIALRFLRAMGCTTTAFTSSPDKRDEVMRGVLEDTRKQLQDLHEVLSAVEPLDLPEPEEEMELTRIYFRNGVPLMERV